MSQPATTAHPAELEALLALLRSLLPELRERYGVSRLAVFGSRVRRDFTPESDLDVLVAFDRPIGLFGVVGLEQELSDRLGVRVDLVIERALKPRLRPRILAEAVPV